jgi:acetylglutamate kinase
MVLKGQVNPQLVAAINVHGNYAVGVSGVDAGLIRATARDPDLGFVGDVTAIDPGVLEGLLDDEFIPVIATIGSDETGQAYNINADTVAGAIAEALGAEKLVYLTDIEGLRRRVDDASSLIRQVDADELDALVADGTIAGGMIPKVAAAPSSGTRTGRATSTSSPGSRSPLSATPIPSSPKRSPSRPAGCCTCPTSSPTPSPPKRP